MSMNFTVKKIVKQETDVGESEKDIRWVASLESGDNRASLSSPDEFDFKVGDGLEVRVSARQQKLA